MNKQSYVLELFILLFFCDIDLMANDVRLSQRTIRKIMFCNGRLAQDTGFI